MAPTGPLTGAEIVCESLLKEGVDVLFGLPGGAVLPLYGALAKYPQLRHILVRHEQGAAYMAFGYAHATGRVGVYTVVPGPGLLNTTAALATAYGCNTPVLAVAGQIPSTTKRRGLGQLHEIPDPLALIRALIN